MIGVILRIVLLGAIVVLIVCAIGLFVMAGVAQSHDVVHIPVPPGTFIAGTMATSNYADAVIAPMRNSTFRDVDRVAQQAFDRGEKEVFRGKREVAYQGEALGFRYYISYILMKDSSPQTLAVATTVEIGPDKKQRYLWKVAKHFHRQLMPYLLDRMVIEAPD